MLKFVLRMTWRLLMIACCADVAYDNYVRDLHWFRVLIPAMLAAMTLWDVIDDVLPYLKNKKQ